MDYNELYAYLTQKLEKAVPLTAYPIRELVQIFRKKGNPVTLKSKLTISSVINSGDISGIMCLVDENNQNKIACSLTHLTFKPDCPLYKEITDYQRKRQKRILQLIEISQRKMN